jgi:hypothetical protein
VPILSLKAEVLGRDFSRDVLGETYLTMNLGVLSEAHGSLSIGTLTGRGSSVRLLFALVKERYIHFSLTNFLEQMKPCCEIFHLGRFR